MSPDSLTTCKGSGLALVSTVCTYDSSFPHLVLGEETVTHSSKSLKNLFLWGKFVEDFFTQALGPFLKSVYIFILELGSKFYAPLSKKSLPIQCSKFCFWN